MAPSKPSEASEEWQLEVPIFGPDSGAQAVAAGTRRIELNRAASYGKTDTPRLVCPSMHVTTTSCAMHLRFMYDLTFPDRRKGYM